MLRSGIVSHEEIQLYNVEFRSRGDSALTQRILEVLKKVRKVASVKSPQS
jgi:hypothetical protein